MVNDRLVSVHVFVNFHPLCFLYSPKGSYRKQSGLKLTKTCTETRCSPCHFQNAGENTLMAVT